MRAFFKKLVHSDATWTFGEQGLCLPWTHCVEWMTLNFRSSCLHVLGAGNNGIEGHAWLSVVIRLDQGLCACLGSPAPAELQPQLVQFWNEVSSESHTCHEHQKKPLSSEVYRDAVVAQVFWKSGMSSLMKLHVSTCCLSSLRSWI